MQTSMADSTERHKKNKDKFKFAREMKKVKYIFLPLFLSIHLFLLRLGSFYVLCTRDQNKKKKGMISFSRFFSETKRPYLPFFVWFDFPDHDQDVYIHIFWDRRESDWKIWPSSAVFIVLKLYRKMKKEFAAFFQRVLRGSGLKPKQLELALAIYPVTFPNSS